MKETIIIPARYNSQRFPGKPLALMHGKPMVQWVYERALLANPARIIIATDDDRIANCAKSFDAEVCMTSTQAATGTDRLAEVVTKLKFADDEIVVNLQGDSPLASPILLAQAGENCDKYQAAISTFKRAIKHSAEITNPGIVKVVTDKDGYALFFSRATIPYNMNTQQLDNLNNNIYYEHLGVYAYRVDFLKNFAQLPPCQLEISESLEQLRALWHGYKIHVMETSERTVSAEVNFPEDISKVESLLALDYAL